MRLITQIFFIGLVMSICFSGIAQHNVHWCGTLCNASTNAVKANKIASPWPSDCNHINKISKKLQVNIHIAQDLEGNTGISQSDINGGLLRLNQEFAPAGIQFEICKQHIMEDDRFDTLFIYPYYSEEKQMSAIYYEPNTINLYLVTTIVQDFGEVAGYAIMPGGKDVVVINKEEFNFNSNVPVHVMGHFFGLYHTFETAFGIELADRSNCDAAGDLVCDTNADPDSTGQASSGDQCNYSGTTQQDPAGNWYVPPTDNYMSFYPDECVCRFSPQQYNRMIEQYLTFRYYLW
jgi:Pregnancy-associated plasma protein-A